MYKVCLLHTTSTLVPIMQKEMQTVVPDVEIFNIVDEAVLSELLSKGEITKWIIKRLSEHVISAEYVGAEIVLFSCSSVSPVVDFIQTQVKIPVIKIDEAMIERAVSSWKNIGIIATADTTVEPTKNLIFSEAQRVGKSVDVKVKLCSEALELFYKGDFEAHDKKVLETVQTLPENLDGIVLAQVSLARLANQIAKPVLSSPRFAVEKVKRIIKSHSNI